MDNTNAWTVVTRKTKIRNDKFPKTADDDRFVSLRQRENLLKEIKRIKETLKYSSFFAKLNQATAQVYSKMNVPALHGDIELVAYGLGSLYQNISAKYQFAAFLLLGECFIDKGICCLGYDPIWTQEDKVVLSHFNVQCISNNEECKRNASETGVTLFYMIHCDKFLYNNLLWQNWNEVQLNRIIIIGNSFSHMYESTPNRIFSKEYQYMDFVIKENTYTEVPLEDWKDHDDIFNNTSIHYFKSNNNTLVKKSTVPPTYEK